MSTRTDLRRRLLLLGDALADRTQAGSELATLDALAGRDPVPVTIGVATYDDYDGAYFTLTALHAYHPEVMATAEILLLDNHPDGVEAAALRKLADDLPRCHYVPVGSVSSTAIRDLAFHIAAGDIVVVLDSHVLLAPGALAAAVRHLEDPTCRDLVQGPMARNSGIGADTHWEPQWRGGMFGVWASDERGKDANGEAFEIPLQGLGVFASRREYWPGLNPHFTGFGGEEGYIHEKYRQHGGRAVCVPAFRWIHRFLRPKGIPYSLKWEDRAFNYTVGWTELGLDVESVRSHLVEHLNADIGTYIDDVRTHMLHPLWRYDGIVVLNDDLAPGRWRRTKAALESISLAPRRLSLPVTDDASAATAVAAAHRYAGYWGWSTYAIIGDEAIDSEGDLDALADRLDSFDPSDVDDSLSRLALSVTGPGSSDHGTAEARQPEASRTIRV